MNNNVDIKPKIDVKPDEIIALTVKSPNGHAVFRIKKSTKMSRVFSAFVERSGVSANAVRFLLDGQNVKLANSAGDLGLADGDQIDAVFEQVGGGDGSHQ